MLKILSIAASLALTGAAFAQSTQPGQTTPSVTPSYTPSVTPSQTPSVIPPSTEPGAPIQTPSVSPSGTPSIGGPPPGMVGGPVGGLNRCENLIGIERDRCLQEEASAATGGTAPRPATTPGAPTR